MWTLFFAYLVVSSPEQLFGKFILIASLSHPLLALE